MSVHLLTPEGMLAPAPYHHVAIGTGSRSVEVAGQVGYDGTGEPTDLTTQVSAALRSTAVGLSGAGAGFADVTRLRFFIVGWSPALMGAFLAGIEAVAEELDIPMPLPPASLIGVESLFADGVLVEIEATAVLD
ncbi:RidA family protein [Microbacterium sp. CJ88]|uniref:RidA family protein n=1 Tax=Microbacterium sp. CJ88 TaxID=3445672 RepID=UPI003F65BC3F